MIKHNWTIEEDYTCCLYYLRYIFDKTNEQNVNYLIYTLSLKLPKISRGSIRMKLQNIKQICMEYNFDDGMEITPLEKYSTQCKEAFAKAIKDYNDSLENK